MLKPVKAERRNGCRRKVRGNFKMRGRESPAALFQVGEGRLRYLPSVPMMPRTAAGRSAGRMTTLALSVSPILRMAST